MNIELIRKIKMWLVICVAILLNVSNTSAQSSTNYQIKKSVLDHGGAASAATSHNVSDAVGQPSPIGQANSPNYIVRSGFLGDGKMMTQVADFEKAELPASFCLFQNYPNPFNYSTTIEFTLPQSAFVMLKVYNLLGEKVATLIAEKREAGIHQFNWDARGLASGVYLYRLEAGSFRQSKKLILMR